MKALESTESRRVLSTMPAHSSPSSEVARLARRACYPCQSLKRRCGKEIPECSLCVRTRRKCEYRNYGPSVQTTPRDQDPQDAASREPVATNHFPASYFLDPLLFSHYNVEIRQPKLPIPRDFMDVIRNMVLVRECAARFFVTIHTWLPILSRPKFYGNLLHQSTHQEPDLVLLVMCMRLLLCEPLESTGCARSPTYFRIKQYFVELDASGGLNITILQAQILVAVYELGHGIYPAAHLTAGACARYGLALGLDREGPRWEHSPSRWIEIEEKHRAWWAIIWLDRDAISHLNISFPKRGLCTEEPTEAWYLPISDKNWNDGEFPLNPPHRLLTGLEAEMGKFARTTQAAHLLGRVLRHVSDTNMDLHFSRGERTSLERALQSLQSLILAEEETSTTHYCSPVALSTSSLLVLYSHLEADTAGIESRASSLTAMEALSRTALSFARKILEAFKSEINIPSPLLLDWMYRSAAVFITLQQDRVCDEYRECERVLTKVIEKLGHRWMVAGVYLELLEARKLATVQLEIST